MVDLLNMDFSGINLFGAASSFMGTLEIIMWSIIIILVLWGAIYILSFKNLVRIRQHTASGYVLIDTKAREFTTKDGAKKWRFLRLKWIRQSYFAPPADHLEFSLKGKFCAEADRSLDGVITWRKRFGKPDGSDTFTGEERTLLGMEMRRADEYKKNNLVNKLIEFTPFIFTVIILVLLFANWGDLMNQNVKSLDASTKALDKMTAAMEKADAMVARQNEILEHTYGMKFPSLNVSVDNKGKDLPLPPN